MNLLNYLKAFVLLLTSTLALASDEPVQVVLTLLSQSTRKHSVQANVLRNDLRLQATDLTDALIVDILCLHEKWEGMTGSWTVIPILPDIAEDYQHLDWAVFVGERANVSLSTLVNILHSYNPNQMVFLGRALRDEVPAIIHHFAFMDSPRSFAYPDFESVFAFSGALVKQLSSRISQVRLRTDFSIDAMHELAMFVWDEGRGSRLTAVPEFCRPVATSNVKGEKLANGNDLRCASTYSATIPVCDVETLTEDDIFVMVKTCEKYHLERLPTVKKLWGDRVKNIEYCSEKGDPSIPTVKLNVKNTESGHCSKLLAILQRAATSEHINSKKWLIVADDDTLLNVHRLARLLSCYDSAEVTAIGERYGYDVRKGKSGYNYITGGGGMVLSMALVRLLVGTGMRCHQDDSPDDMMLGIWLATLGVPITHSPLFHQTSPDSYSPDYVSHQESISFHKFTNINPEVVYKQWLSDVDANDQHSDRRHSEL